VRAVLTFNVPDAVAAPVVVAGVGATKPTVAAVALQPVPDLTIPNPGTTIAAEVPTPYAVQ
jgi:hypothetical protein